MDKNVFYLLCLLLLVAVAHKVVSQHAELRGTTIKLDSCISEEALECMCLYKLP